MKNFRLLILSILAMAPLAWAEVETFSFAWSAVDRADGYRLYLNNNPITEVAGTQEQVDLDVTSGRLNFAVEAFNEFGAGPRAVAAIDYTEPVPPEPQTPPEQVEGFVVDIVEVDPPTEPPTEPPTPGAQPYDLSVFDIPFEYQWPESPRTTSTITVVSGDIGSFREAVATPNTVVLLPDGNYVGTVSFADDVDVVASDGARWVLPGDQSLSSGQRVRWTGGVIDGQGMQGGLIFVNRYDFLFDNVRFENVRSIYPFFGQEGGRIAFINSTATTEDYFVFSQGSFTGTPTKYENIIVANCNIRSGLNGGEATIRLQRVRGAIVVDSWLENDTRHSLRSHYGAADIYASDNLIIGASLQAHYTNGSGADTARPEDHLGAHYIYRNTYYNERFLNVQRGPNGAGDFHGPMIVEDNVAYNVNQTNAAGEANRRFPATINPGDRTAGNMEFPFRAPPLRTEWVNRAGVVPGADH